MYKSTSYLQLLSFWRYFFVSVSLMRENLRVLREKLKHKIRLLVDPNAVLEEIGIREDDAILVEVRFTTFFTNFQFLIPKFHEYCVEHLMLFFVKT